jgi:hypothetical protein
MLNSPELIPPRNQCQQFRESVPTNSYHTRNQLPLIPTDSRNRLQFRLILESHDHRTIPLLHYRYMHSIPERNSENSYRFRNSGNWFRFRNCTEFKGETADFVLLGFLEFLWYSRDFWDFYGIPRIFMRFPGFQWDSRDLQDFPCTPNPYLYYVLYLAYLSKMFKISSQPYYVLWAQYACMFIAKKLDYVSLIRRNQREKHEFLRNHWNWYLC